MEDFTRRTLLSGALLSAAIGFTEVAPAQESKPQNRISEDQDGHPQIRKANTLDSAQAISRFKPVELAAMQKVATDFMAKFRVPALSVAIAKEGRLVYAHAFGNATQTEPATPRHVFRIASVTKPFTSAAILHLVEQGKLKRSDKVVGTEGVLGKVFGAPPYKPYVADITVDHLLTHTCGGWPNDGTDPMFSHIEMNHHELIRWTLQNVPITHQPGTHWAYSNFGYCLLGRIVEKVAGKKYETAVRNEILHRCGITGMSLAGNTLQDRHADEVQYYGQSGEDPYDKNLMNVTRMDSHGGWLATPTDLVRFLVRVDGFPSVPDLLKPDTLNILTTPTSALGGKSYGRGWFVNSLNNYWHNGSLPGTSTIMVRTSGGFCWAALTNTRTPGIDGALDKMVWNMTGKIIDWPEHDLFS